MSDTPRTDAHCQTIWSNDPHCPGPVSTVSASFARELERELNALRASQSEALDEGGVRNARRWVFYASSPQTALMLGTKLDPNDNSVDWVKECNRLANAAMRQSAPERKE